LSGKALITTVLTFSNYYAPMTIVNNIIIIVIIIIMIMIALLRDVIGSDK